MAAKRKIIENYDSPPLMRGPSAGEACPELVRQWDEKANCGFSVYDFGAGSQIHAHWKCWIAPDHRWQALIANVVNSARKADYDGKERKGAIGCPFCHGLRPSSTNTLLMLCPSVAEEWHKSKNKFGPSDVTVCSTKKVWWTCPEGHDYQAQISNRTHNQSGCPKCNLGEPIDLREYKEVLREFDTENNPGIDPFKLPVGLKANWICSNDNTHKWRSGFYRTQGDRCPLCRGLSPSKKNDPSCVPQLEESGDSGTIPNDGSTDRIRWRCDMGEDHLWTTTKQTRRTGTQCPFCANKQLSVTNALPIRYPGVAKEWHPKKNGKKTPDQVIYSSTALYYWLCQNGHVWRTSPYCRTVKGQGCGQCHLSK